MRIRLSAACRAGKVDQVTSMLSEHDAETTGMFIDAQDMSSEFEYTAVTMCFREDHIEILALLLTNEACDKTIKMGRTPLYVAASAGKESCIKLLIANGGEVNKARDDGYAALTTACQKWPCCSRVLVDLKRHFDQRGGQRRMDTSLHFVSKWTRRRRVLVAPSWCRCRRGEERRLHCA